MSEFLQFLGATGDVGVWLFLLAFWRIDRRIFRLERKVFPNGVPD